MSSVDLSIDLSSILAAAASAVGGVLAWRIKRHWTEAAEAAKAEAETRQEERERTAAALAEVGQSVADVAQRVERLDMRMTARFDALQTAVDGHAREIDIGREARGKLYVAQDALRERVVRLETVQAVQAVQAVGK
jgi:hypothetical protein